jgi:hypothetical protein
VVARRRLALAALLIPCARRRALKRRPTEIVAVL